MTIRQRSLAGHNRWLFVLGLVGACQPAMNPGQPGGPGDVDAAVALDGSGGPGGGSGGPGDAGYSVSGNMILDSAGHVFIPNGVQLGAINFASSSWKTNDSSRFTADVVRMAHDFWHSNTTRIQVSSRNLFASSPYDAAYLARIDELVGFANQADMNLILSLQYEGVSNAPLMPTQDSVKFWDMMSKHFAGNPRVFFDIFNEPSPGAITGNGDTADSWMFWQNGRTVGGTTYVGMQQLVDTIRGNGANNLIFAEGICIAACLDLVTTYPLKGSNIVYATHPYFGNNRTTTAMWDKYFGNASKTLPVVADEWGVYDSTSSECVAMASTIVDQFLPYLEAHHVGVICFSLWPGTMGNPGSGGGGGGQLDAGANPDAGTQPDAAIRPDAAVQPDAAVHPDASTGGANGIGVASGTCTQAEITGARLNGVNYWTCQGNGRYICDDHSNKVVEACPSGCVSEGVGVDDQCSGGGGPSCTAGEITGQTGAGSAMPSIWTCQTGNRYVCDGRGFKVTERCANGCQGEGFGHDDQCL